MKYNEAFIYASLHIWAPPPANPCSPSNPSRCSTPGLLGSSLAHALLMLSYVIQIPQFRSYFPTMASESGKFNHKFGWESKHYIHLQMVPFSPFWH